MAVFEVIGYIYNGLPFCNACGRHLPYIDDFGHDKKRIYAWQRENHSHRDGKRIVYVCCTTCNKSADKWR